MRKVTKQEFDTYLNYFQDKIEHYDFARKIKTYFDGFDTVALAETKDGEYYLYD